MHLCRTPQRICVCVYTCNVLHNPTHTLFLLYQMNQFLQNFIQHPEEAERRGKHSSLVSSSPPSVLLVSPRGPYLPLMLKFFPSIRCLREGCLEKAGMTASKSASKPAHNTQTHITGVQRQQYYALRSLCENPLPSRCLISTNQLREQA